MVKMLGMHLAMTRPQPQGLLLTSLLHLKERKKGEEQEEGKEEGGGAGGGAGGGRGRGRARGGRRGKRRRMGKIKKPKQRQTQEYKETTKNVAILVKKKKT